MNKNYSRVILISLSVVMFLAFATVASATVWHVPGDFATIQEAIDDASVLDGDKIMVGLGTHVGALVHKSVEIKGEEGAVINSGPAHGSGLTQGFRLLTGSDGTTISHLRFEVSGLDIMNGDAVNDVSVSQCTFINSVQAISNWRGNRWNIDHNEIIDLRTRCGGGIGIFIGDYTGGVVTDNVVAHNKISGTLHVDPNDCGGYCGTGIVIYADFRGNRTGAETLAYNRVIKNKVSLVSDNSELVPVVAFELTDTRYDVEADPYPVVFDNSIGFNDFRGTVDQIVLTPGDLDDCNKISRNLGDNRGHGLHPKVIFRPHLD